jgi:hypothetical protein
MRFIREICDVRIMSTALIQAEESLSHTNFPNGASYAYTIRTRKQLLFHR